MAQLFIAAGGDILDDYAHITSEKVEAAIRENWAVYQHFAPPAADAVPEGYALVPVTLTIPMIEAFESVHFLDDGNADAAWAAMLAAAQQDTQP